MAERRTLDLIRIRGYRSIRHMAVVFGISHSRIHQRLTGFDTGNKTDSEWIEIALGATIEDGELRLREDYDTAKAIRAATHLRVLNSPR